MTGVLGLHHITAITGDLQRNLEFYAGTLGLRLVKQTVNFDDPRSLHISYGDASASPGSLLTFIVWPGSYTGRQGTGQAAVVSMAIAPSAIGAWIERLLRHGIRFEGPTVRRVGDERERVLSFADPEGMKLEIVAHAAVEQRAPGARAPGLDERDAIRGLHAATLWVERAEPTERVLVDALGLRAVGEDENTRHYAPAGGAAAGLVSVREVGGFVKAEEGAGTVHHVAWRASDVAHEESIRARLLAMELEPTGVLERKYFESVYVREPGGVLLELATDAPGLTLDEPADRLGEALMLPPWLEARRAELEAVLPRARPPSPASAADSAFGAREP